MKKILLLFFISGLAILCHSQGPLDPVLKKYFRAHPFDGKFSSFIVSLQKDPWFTIQDYDRRTDSSFFYFSGLYKNFNPFRYPAMEVRLVVAEQLFIHSDSLQTLDTIINFQMMGITAGEETNKEAVIKEFRRFHSTYSREFSKAEYKDIKNNNVTVAEIYNYFIFPFSISPLTIAWGPIPETGQYTFTITFRFKVKQNIADLIIAAGGL